MSDKLVAVLSALAKKSSEDGKGRFDELLYAEKLRKKMPPVRTIGDDWHAYEDGAWLPVTREQYLPLALSMCPKRYRKARNAQNLLDHVQAATQVRIEEMAGFYREFTEEDGTKSILINASNGVVKIWDGGETTLEKHKEEYGFTTRAAAKYDEKATAPLFTSLIEAALPDTEDREVLQVFCGNILWPTSQHECALISYGLEGTSKSTIAEAIVHALANPNDHGDLVTSLSMTQICDSRSYSLPKLRLASLNLGTEVDTVDLDESTNFKQVVSGEKVEARGIYKKPMAMRTTCKLWFLANTLPRFKNGTGAELRRLRFLQFDIVPEKKDTTLKERLKAERDGIFMWMIEGLLKLKSSGGIPHGGPKSRAVVDKFSISNDPVGYFVRNHCVFDSTSRVEKDLLANAFKDFLAEHGLPDHFGEWFFRRLYERFSHVKPARQRSGDGMDHYVQGIMRKERVLEEIG